MPAASRRRLAAVIAPPALWLIAFLVAPLLLLSAYSFRAGVGGALFRDWVPTLEQYRILLATPAFLRLLAVSVGIALLEAAASLGATPRQRFWRVTVPLSLPGVLAGAVMVFIPTVGEYVTPSLVGGSSGSMYGNIIFDFFGRSANWPFGAALAVVMLVLTLVLVGATSRISRIERFIG